jgi:hypothetical protein
MKIKAAGLIPGLLVFALAACSGGPDSDLQLSANDSSLLNQGRGGPHTGDHPQGGPPGQNKKDEEPEPPSDSDDTAEPIYPVDPGDGDPDGTDDPVDSDPGDKDDVDMGDEPQPDPDPPETVVYHGIAVDPYIVGATFFEDVNGNGRWDEGEQISTPSDAQGRFSFTTPVPAGRAIVMHERGYHQGLPFTGRLLARVEEGAPERVVISPLTTLAALGLPTEELSSLLSLLNNYSAYDVSADPMAGLEQIGKATDDNYDAAVAGLRANLYVGAILELFMLNRDHSGITADDLRDLLNNWEPLPDLMEGLHYLVSADAIARVAAKLPGGYNLPPVTMREVAEAAPALLGWWQNESLGAMVSAATFKAKADSVQADLTLHYYVRNNQNNEAVQRAIEDGALQVEFAGEDHVALQKDGSIGAVEGDIREELLVAQVFSVGYDGQLRFLGNNNGYSGTAELVYQNGDGSPAEITGTWRIENSELLLQGTESDGILRLELKADWACHLAMRIKGEPQGDYAAGSFIGRLLGETGQFTVAGN